MREIADEHLQRTPPPYIPRRGRVWARRHRARAAMTRVGRGGSGAPRSLRHMGWGRRRATSVCPNGRAVEHHSALSLGWGLGRAFCQSPEPRRGRREVRRIRAALQRSGMYSPSRQAYVVSGVSVIRVHMCRYDTRQRDFPNSKPSARASTSVEPRRGIVRAKAGM